MQFEIVLVSLALAVALLSSLAAKWQIKMGLAIGGGVVIGLVGGLLASWIGYRLHLALPLATAVDALLIVVLTTGTVLMRFYRDPNRTPPERRGVILSPADGKILYVKRIENFTDLITVKGKTRITLDEITNAPWLFERGYLIGIGMNLLNVHVNRAPLGGRVVLLKRTKGAFLSLRRPEAEALNERVTWVIDDEGLQIAMVQIASRLVRSIVSYLKQGDSVSIGQRVGMIRFGSQVDLVVPDMSGGQVVVKPGEKVLAGISVIARYNTRVAWLQQREKTKVEAVI